ncbi:MAG TPA: HIT domain-containing protein [Rubrobacteraceae bacterium]|nr:HIT domain-containing protein [Rubrobacteraceae bacterium]
MSENGCVFCKVAGGEEESEIVHDEEGMMAFHSIGGQAPVHVLVILKEHIFSLQEIDKFPDGVAKRIFEVAREVAERMGIEASGYAFRSTTARTRGRRPSTCMRTSWAAGR